MGLTANDISIKKSMGLWKPNVYLSNMCIAYYEEPQYAHKRIFPVCQVDLPSGKYYEFSKSDLARDNVQLKPPYGSVAPAVFGISEKSYSCKLYQVQIGLDKIMVLPYQRTNAPGSANADRARVKTITEQIAIHQERDFSEKFFKSGVWANEWQGAATANTAQKKFLKFDDSSCDPVDFIDGLSIEIRRNGRRKPNKLALGIETFAALKNNPEIKSRVKYSGTTQNPAVVNEQVLAQIFGVDEVIVLDATYNAAKHGAPDDMRYVCDSKGALLLYVPETPAIDSPAAGYCFTWNFSNSDYIAVQTYDGAPGTHTTIMEGILAYAFEKTSDDLAVYLSSCVG